MGQNLWGKAALDTGINVAKDVLAGNNLKDSARARLQQTAQTVKQQALDHIKSQVGSGGTGKRKSLKRKPSQKKITLPQASRAKRPKIVLDDIFKD